MHHLFPSFDRYKLWFLFHELFNSASAQPVLPSQGILFAVVFWVHQLECLQLLPVPSGIASRDLRCFIFDKPGGHKTARPIMS